VCSTRDGWMLAAPLWPAVSATWTHTLSLSACEVTIPAQGMEVTARQRIVNYRQVRRCEFALYKGGNTHL